MAALPDFVHQMSKQPRLLDKVCLISGASRGFGQAIAVRFVEEGAKVALLAREECHATMELIQRIPGLERDVSDIAVSLCGDISKEEDCIKAAKAVADKWGGRIDVLVNNACTFVFQPVETATEADWDLSLSVNVKGHALLTKAALPFMKSGGGSIVFQGSISSFLAQPNCSTYAAAKAAIVQLSRSCAYDLAKYNIRVNTVCAGTVETPISKEERAAHGWSYEEWQALKTKDVMLRRVGTVREVANATLFYACDESSYCTGSHLLVDGGQTACTVMAE